MSTVMSDQPGQPVLPVESMQASVQLNMNITTVQPLFVVPTGRTFIPTRVVLRACSGSLTTASVGFGRNATPTDFAASATYTGLTDATKIAVVQASASAGVAGAAADTFAAKCSIAQGGAMTVQCEVFGYLV